MKIREGQWEDRPLHYTGVKGEERGLPREEAGSTGRMLHEAEILDKASSFTLGKKLRNMKVVSFIRREGLL